MLALAALVAPALVSAQHFAFRHYAQAEGLTNLAVGYLIEARDADMWIGTDSGVFVFDGVSFAGLDRRQGLFKEPVRGIAQDPAGRLWVAFDRGVFRGDKSGFAPVRVASGTVTADAGMPIVFVSDEQVWLTVDHQVVELRRAAAPVSASTAAPSPGTETWTATPLFSAAQLRERPALANVRSLFNAPDGTLWLGCGRGLCSVAAGITREWGPADGVPESDWSLIRSDRDGQVWARSATHLVMRKPAAARFDSPGAPNSELKSGLTLPVLAFDAQGRAVTRTASGIARREGAGWREFTPANGLPGVVISAVSSDASGDLWLAVAGQGLWHWQGYGHLESWGRAEGMSSDSVWGIVRDPAGRLIFGSDHACEWVDEARRRVERCPFVGLPSQQTIALTLDDAGGLWFGLDGASIWRVRPGQLQAEAVGKIGERGAVSQITFDAKGHGWVGGNGNGLHRLDRGTGEMNRLALPGNPRRVWESTVDSRGRRCIASANGLHRVVDGRAEHVPIARDGTLSGFVSVTADGAGGIWATPTGQGLLHAPGCDAAGATWVNADIVANAHAYFVRRDQRGWVWVGTDQGVAIFDGKTWQRLDVGDGLVWNDTNENAFFADTDGSVWIGTAAGMTHVIDPAGLMARRALPLDLRLASASLGEQALAEDGVTRVPWERDASFDLRFASHSHERSANTEFQYRLIGLSPKWLGSRLPEVHLPALAPGSYRLEVRMSDPDHAQQSPVLVRQFVVVPPWWRSPSFYVALAFLGAAALTIAWRTQVRRLHARRVAIEAEYREREALLQRATRDGLTGLWNRSAILEILGREIAQARRTGAALTIALLDVDHFKQVNDTHGHLAGDEVLRELGVRVGDALRQSDWIGRYGGEELLAVLPGLTLAEAAAPIERLRECVCERPFSARGQSIVVTLSIGLAGFDARSERTEDIIARADAALYDAKRAGRNRVVHAPAVARDPVEMTET